MIEKFIQMCTSLFISLVINKYFLECCLLFKQIPPLFAKIFKQNLGSLKNNIGF